MPLWGKKRQEDRDLMQGDLACNSQKCIRLKMSDEHPGKMFLSGQSQNCLKDRVL